MSLFTKRDRYIAKSLAKSMFHVFSFILVFGITFIIYGGQTLQKISKNLRNYLHYRNIEYSYNDIKQKILEMNGFQFEKFCGKLYEQLGYKVEYTDQNNDYGRDLILNNSTFVECKHYTGDNYVGREICQKLIGSMESFNITEGIVITTGHIHQNAFEYANRLTNKNIDFVNFNDIMNMVDNIEPTKIPLMIESCFVSEQDNFKTIFKEIYE